MQFYLDKVFSKKANFPKKDIKDFNLYKSSEKNLEAALSDLGAEVQMYGQRGRQMILADLFEYIFFGRVYYAMVRGNAKKRQASRENFIRAVLNFVNMLMCYEVITVSPGLRKKVIVELGKEIPSITEEESYDDLEHHQGTIGLPSGESDADGRLDKYFDSILPKTAGGLWHELLVYTFLLRNDFGYIIPLLLSQRFIGLHDHIVPPDFLLVGNDKRLYGIEVGMKKEIQSGGFSIRTGIPTATIDTINSRTSDRCPSCKKWIAFCPHVINNYSNLDVEIPKTEVRCLTDCSIYQPEEIVRGACPFTKYARKRLKTMSHTHHDFSDGRHYHYKCVLENVSPKVKKELITAEDSVALKTHFPYYSGLGDLKVKTFEETRVDPLEGESDELTPGRPE